MQIFPAIGLAVAGIFITVCLSGVLAGVVAFGLIENRSRRIVQRRVVEQLVDEPFARFVDDRRYRSGADEESWADRTLRFLQAERRGQWSLAALVLLDADRLFSLPYRQLCGQIANAVAMESRHSDEEGSDDEVPVQPLTLVLAIADAMVAERPDETDGFFHPAHARARALAFLDAIQIELANQVLHRARQIAFVVISIICLAILVPNLDALNVFAESDSTVAHAAGIMLAACIAFVLVMALAFAATIVASLTFRWIDRFASAR